MATRKTLRISCDPETAAAFAEAIRRYADAAYPPGGSECAQVAHETLTDTARVVAWGHRQAESAEVEFPRRQRVMLKAAVDWYLEQHGDGLPDTVRTRLRQLFSPNPS